MNLDYTISIKKDSNKIISSTVDKFSSITPGCFIKIGSDNILYNVIDKSKFLYTSDFNVENSKIISINADVGINLQKNDVLKISYKEYEAVFVEEIVSSDSGFRADEEIFLKLENAFFDLSIGRHDGCVLKIDGINQDGQINSVSIKSRGKYTSQPNCLCEGFDSVGKTAKFKIKFIDIPERKIMEKTIKDIYFSDGKTFIVFDYSLPISIKSGKIYAEKTTATLSQNYLGETSKNCYYESFNHFTPNLKIPLLVKNSISQDIVYNKGAIIMDEAYQSLKSQIEIIKKHIGLH